jgi:hypothetical protein
MIIIMKIIIITTIIITTVIVMVKKITGNVRSQIRTLAAVATIKCPEWQIEPPSAITAWGDTSTC